MSIPFVLEWTIHGFHDKIEKNSIENLQPQENTGAEYAETETFMDYIIEMLDITKEFPGIKANDHITLQIKKGEIHALLGENGAGKSTLMSVLFGLYQPDGG